MNYKEIIEKFEPECYKDDSSFDNILSYYNVKNRCLFLEDIEEGVGGAINAMIQFFNMVDDEENIPIEERQPIKIYINSPGGYLTETFMMIDAIKLSKTPVWGIVTGTAYSGGAFTLLACHKRIAYPHASIMFHEGATGNSGDSHKFVNYTEFYKKELDKLKELVISNSNITEELYEKNKRDDWWMDTEEALKLGVINEITEKLI